MSPAWVLGESGLLYDIQSLLHEFALSRHDAVLQWVPNHSDILGNEKGDCMVRGAHCLPYSQNHWLSQGKLYLSCQKGHLIILAAPLGSGRSYTLPRKSEADSSRLGVGIR